MNDDRQREVAEHSESYRRDIPSFLRAEHDSVTSNATGPLRARRITDTDSTQRRDREYPSMHLALAASVLLALAVPIYFFLGDQGIPEPTYFESAIGERRTVDLEDGSVVTLSADSRTAVTMTDNDRLFALLHGEIFISVASEPARPFRVDVGTHRVTVTGTSFDVWYRDRPGRITVYEGQVEVSPIDGDEGIGGPKVLREGQRLVLESGAVPTVLSQDELETSADRRNGWLHFDNDSLATVAEELAPYIDRRIVFASEDVAELEIGGSFNTDRVDPALSALESVVPIEISDDGEQLVISLDPDRAR